MPARARSARTNDLPGVIYDIRVVLVLVFAHGPLPPKG